MEQIMELIQAFLETQNWEEAHILVVQNADMMLSDAVQEQFGLLIDTMEAQGYADVVANLIKHRDVLLQCREHGITAAFEGLEANRVPQPAVMQAIQNLLMAEDVRTARSMIETHQALLVSDDALQIFDFNIAQAEAEGDANAVAVFTEHRNVLAACQSHGIEETFERLLAGQLNEPPMITAIKAFLDSESWDVAHAIVENNEALLLSDDAIELFERFIVHAETEQNSQVAENFVRHRDILLDCREYGIAMTFTALKLNPLVHRTIHALVHGAAERQALSESLSQQIPATPEEHDFVAAIQQALADGDLETLGEALAPPYDVAWSAIQEGVGLDGLPATVISQLIEDTVRFYDPCSEPHTVWRQKLAEFHEHLTAEQHPAAGLTATILALLAADGDPSGLGTGLVGRYAQAWQAIKDGILELT